MFTFNTLFNSLDITSTTLTHYITQYAQTTSNFHLLAIIYIITLTHYYAIRPETIAKTTY